MSRRQVPACRPMAAWAAALLVALLPAAQTAEAQSAGTPAAVTQLPRLEVALTPLIRPGKLLREKLTVGDQVEVVLTLTAPSPLQGPPRFPTWGAGWGDAEVLDKADPIETGERVGSTTWSQRIVIAAYRTGRIALPPVAVAVPLAARTVEATTPDGLALEVASVLPAPAPEGGAPPGAPAGLNLRPKPAAPPRPLPLGAAFWWTAAGLSTACLALGLLLLRRRATATAAARPALSPFAELAAGLAALDPEGSALVFHTRLSLALRRYLGRALGFQAVESTTSEIHRRLAGRHLPAATVRHTIELLRACDLVKFGQSLHREVSAARSRERAAVAKEIAAEVEEHLRPEPEDTAAPAEQLLKRAG